ncbi:MAG: glycerophosphodiester phosphodiesterase, partial [Caulobacter sp.]|nr:glycerophosphodiester phosphodiesterase [Vitreoscilla sp.]
MVSRQIVLARLAPLFVATAAAAVLAACGGNDSSPPPAPTPLLTLDGSVPLVIGHRGLPGLYPEETLPAYEGAPDAGADSLEEDLHMTRDCVLVARHNPWLSDNT